MELKNADKDVSGVLRSLMSYIKEGNLESIKKLIRETGIVGNRDIFRVAIHNGNIEIVKYLYKKKCPIGSSAVCLISAVNNKDMEMVKYLNEIGMVWSGSSINAASASGSIELLRYMLENNIKLNYDYVVYGGSLECLKFVVDLGYTLTTEDMIAACRADSLELLLYVLSHLGDVVITDVTAEGMYLNVTNIEVLDYIEDVMKVPIPSTALETYVEDGRIELTKHACEKGWKVSCDDTYRAISSANLELVEYFHEKGHPFYDDEEWDEICCNIYSDGKVMKYYHDNIYSGDCHVEGCKFCKENKIETLQNMWYMETAVYDSYNQWYPREVLEDVIELVTMTKDEVEIQPMDDYDEIGCDNE